MIAVAEHPILFQPWKVRRILAWDFARDGDMQTRRVMRPQPVERRGEWWYDRGKMMFALPSAETRAPEQFAIWETCPYGVTGDHLWVRESGWLDREESRFFVYEATRNIARQGDTGGFIETLEAPPMEAMRDQYRHIPSIHSPRWTSRILLLNTRVRIEPTKEISEEDARREGVDPIDGSYRTGFLSVFDGINGKRGYRAESNTWNWVIDFRPVVQERAA